MATIPRLSRQERPPLIPLSYAQQRLWFIDRLSGGRNAEYHRVAVLRMRGVLDVDVLQRAIDTIVERHEILRTRFVEVDGEPVQIVEPPSPLVIAVDDLARLGPDEQDAAIDAAIRREFDTPFDLSRGPLLRLRLLTFSSEHHVFVRAFHHIVADGWSESVFYREVATLYDAYRAGGTNPLPPLGVQYADFALWQRGWIEEAMESGMAYWRRHLAGVATAPLPTDYPRPLVPTFEAEQYEHAIPDDLVAALKQFGRANGATLYMTLLTAFAALLSRYTGQDEVLVASPIANRTHAALEDLIGFFVNTLVLRVRPRADESCGELLRQVRQTALAAYRHQDVPFERVVETLGPARRLDGDAILPVGFVVQNAPWTAPSFAGVTAELLRRAELRVRFDIEVHVWQRQGVVIASWLYRRDLFLAERIAQMARHHLRIAAAMIADPGTPHRAVDLLDDVERRQLLTGCDATGDASASPVACDLLERLSASAPDAVAVDCGAQQLTYGELLRRGTQVAHALRRMGVREEHRVAVCLDRSLDLVVAIVGVLRAGAAYVPLDAEYPPERLADVVRYVAAPVVLTRGSLQRRLAGAHVACLRLDVDWPWIATYAVVAPETARHRAGAAYVISTSGSTGRPKPVIVTHDALADTLAAARELLALRAEDSVAAVASIAFDIATLELMIGWTTGSRTVLVDDTERMDVARLAERLRFVTVLHLVPSVMREFLRPIAARTVVPPPAVRMLLTGGERVPADVLRAIRNAFPHAQLRVLYGPTEAAIICASAHIQRPAEVIDAAVGTAMASTRLYVLDDGLQSVPVGVAGELYVSGRGVARGYLGLAAHTATRFVADPHALPGARMYRTGDRVRRRFDGALEFVGRADLQIKIRGFRIEPAEIEAALRDDARVLDAVVTTHGASESPALVGYVACREEPRDDDRAAHLAEWRQLYETVYREGDGGSDFDLVGWVSSYTGEPIPADEMRAWVEETVARLRALAPRRVLEVGCGTGLLLTRVAGDCERYVGIDFSPAVLHRLGSYLQRRPELQHVELREGEADDLTFLADGSIDLVILNSVVQYFPDVDYLLTSLREALRVLRDGGYLFIGDVRSLPLLEAYHGSVELHKAIPSLPVSELRARIRQAVRREEELVVDPELFLDLARRWHGIGRVRLMPKTGDYDNEISRFRYDVTITRADKEFIAAPRHSIEWDVASPWRGSVERILADAPGSSVAIRRILDRRVAPAVAAARIARNAEAAAYDAAQVRTLTNAAGGADLGEIQEWATRLVADLSWVEPGGDGAYDLVLNPRWLRGDCIDLPDDDVANRRHTNAPARRGADRAIAAELQEQLRRRLPTYMVPSAIVVLDALPRTVQGKVDRTALPPPETRGSAGEGGRPRTPDEELLCALFEEVLGVDHVGRDDDFFELGGHSLLSTRLANRIRSMFGTDVDVRTVFEAPRVRDLAARLRDAAARTPPLVPRPRGAPAPASAAQRRLWFIDRLRRSHTPEYHIAVALRLRGALDIGALERAVAAMVRRHDVLRTHFAEGDGEPVPIVEDSRHIEIPVDDVRQQSEEQVSALLTRYAYEPFDLAAGPVLRLRLLRVADDQYVLLRAVHHIAFDGWSDELFNRELLALYDAFQRGLDDPLSPLRVQYGDYAAWQRECSASPAGSGVGYWRSQLADAPEPLLLPTDRPRRHRQTFGGAIHRDTVPAELVSRLRQLGRRHGVTLYMTLLAGFAALLARYTGRDDMLIGSPIANRRDEALHDLIGLFVNTLALRVRVDPLQPYTQLLADVRRTTLDAFRHQDVPFEHVVDMAAPARRLDVAPLVPVTFALQTTSPAALSLPGLVVEPLRLGDVWVRADLEVHAWDRRSRFDILWVYNRDLFDAWRIDQMGQLYRGILAAMAQDPTRSIEALDATASDASGVSVDRTAIA